MKRTVIALIVITISGAYLRFDGLDLKPLFTDEALLGVWVRHSFPMQEWVPLLLCKLMPDTEFGLRFLFALSGTLTIPAIYLVVKEQKLLASLIVAIFPLFIFWSKMARPYAMAGLFLVLGWKWFWFYIPALLSTPIALLGVKLLKQKWWVIVGAVVFSLIMYFIRPDASRFTNSGGLEMWTYASRFWYLPALAIILYLFEFKIKYVQYAVGIVVLFLAVQYLPNLKTETEMLWYRKEVRFADWRDKEIDYGTNVLQSMYYTGGKPKYFRTGNLEGYIKDLESDTLLVGVDYLIYFPISYSLFNNNFSIWRYDGEDYPMMEFLRVAQDLILDEERVFRFKAYIEKNTIIYEVI